MKEQLLDKILYVKVWERGPPISLNYWDIPSIDLKNIDSRLD